MKVPPALPALRKMPLPSTSMVGDGVPDDVMSASVCISQVPAMERLACAVRSMFADPVQVAPFTCAARWLRVLLDDPDNDRGPCTSSAPLPEMVPPDQVMFPVTVTLSAPVR